MALPEEGQGVVDAGEALEAPRRDAGSIDLLDDPCRKIAQRSTNQPELEVCRVEVELVDAVRLQEPAWVGVIDHGPQVVLTWAEPGPVPVECCDDLPVAANEHVGAVEIVVAEDIGHGGRASSCQHCLESVQPHVQFVCSFG